MNKKKAGIILLIVTAFTVLILCFTFMGISGCAQEKQESEFNSAYVKIGEDWKELEVAGWSSQGEQMKLTLKDGSVLVVHQQNCVLFNGTLPE